jgi:hypothetical protein
MNTLIFLAIFFALWYIGGKHSLKLIADEDWALRLAQLVLTQWHNIDVVLFVTDGKKLPLFSNEVLRVLSLLQSISSFSCKTPNGELDIFRCDNWSTSMGDVSWVLNNYFYHFFSQNETNQIFTNIALIQ